MSKKFAQSLSNAEIKQARRFEAAGLTTFSQAVKAFERGNVDQIAAWEAALNAPAAALFEPVEVTVAETQETQEEETMNDFDPYAADRADGEAQERREAAQAAAYDPLEVDPEMVAQIDALFPETTHAADPNSDLRHIIAADDADAADEAAGDFLTRLRGMDFEESPAPAAQETAPYFEAWVQDEAAKLPALRMRFSVFFTPEEGEERNFPAPNGGEVCVFVTHRAWVRCYRNGPGAMYALDGTVIVPDGTHIPDGRGFFHIPNTPVSRVVAVLTESEYAADSQYRYFNEKFEGWLDR